MNELEKIWHEVEGGAYRWNSLERLEANNRRYTRRDPWAVIEPFRARDRCTSEFSWAIPTDAALELLAALAPLVEIGAGTGYWAHLLRERGVDVIAYDIAPPSGEHWNGHLSDFHRYSRPHTEVLWGTEAMAARHADRTLFLCWPPLNSMAYNALRFYQGERVVYIGEHGGMNADDRFFFYLTMFFEETDRLTIPQWFGINDYLAVFTRRGDVPEIPEAKVTGLIDVLIEAERREFQGDDKEDEDG